MHAIEYVVYASLNCLKANPQAAVGFYPSHSIVLRLQARHGGRCKGQVFARTCWNEAT